MSLNWNHASTCGENAPGVAEALLEGLAAPSVARGGGEQHTQQRLNSIRQQAADYFGFKLPQRVIFTPGLTFAINQFIHGVLKAGDTVLASRLEHNACWRPLHAFEKSGGKLIESGFLENGLLDLEQLEESLANNSVDWVILTAGSNVLGTIQPVRQAAKIAGRYGAKVFCDLAQVAGLLPIDFEQLGLSAAAAPGHKGLLGPRGVGILMLAPDLQIKPLIQGGTGSFGESREMPSQLPEALEAGTQNYPGIFALGAALCHLATNPIELNSARKKMTALDTWLRQQDHFDVYPKVCPGWKFRLPIISFNLRSISSDVFGSFLNSQGLNIRSGLLCAGATSEDLLAPHGVLRLSPASDADDAEYQQVKKIISLAVASLM